MVFTQIQRSAWLALGLLLVASPGWAEVNFSDSIPLGSEATEAEIQAESGVVTAVPRLHELEHPATTVTECLAQSPLVQITGVQLNATAQGLELQLETIGELSQSAAPSIMGNALVVDIENATLALPDSDEFQQANPAEGIALVSVTALPGDRVRVAITGVDAPPTAAVRVEAQGLVLAVTPGTEGTVGAEDEAIQVVVTGETEDYGITDTPATTRLDVPLRDNPRSLQIIPQQVVEDQAVTRIGDALRNVSGVVQDGGFGGTVDQFNIRGFSLFEFFRDGFRTTGGILELSNVERIEVLRGPASILFGNVEPGGVVNVVTEQPLAFPAYEIEGQIGSDGFIHPTVDLSGPLTSDRTVRYRLNVAYEGFDGFRDFDQNVERFFIAPIVSWDISDNTTVTLDFSYLNDERPFDRGFIAIGRDIVDVPLSRFFGEPDDFAETEEVTAGYRIEHRLSEAWRIRNAFRGISSSTLDYRAEPLVLDETTGILTRNFRSNNDVNESYTLQTELAGNFTTGTLGHNLVFGVDLARQASNGTQSRFPTGLTPSLNIFDPDYNQIARPGLDELTTVVRNGNNRTDSLGIFVQDLITITDDLKLLLAGRLDFVEQDNRDRISSTTSGQNLAAFSPTIGLLYQPIEPLSIYANYARSFQPNFGTSVDNSFLDPERGTQYEIGVRGELLNGRLIASLAAYRIEKSNVATVDPNNPDFSIPAGSQRSQGIELDVIGQILPGWNVIASYGHIDAEITESNDLPSGSRIQNVPRNTASLWTTYEIQQGDLQGLGFGFGLFYIGERAGNFSDTFDLPDYLRTDAALFYRRDNWRAALNIQNLFDVEYFRSNNFGRVAIEPGAPLTVIGSLTVEF